MKKIEFNTGDKKDLQEIYSMFSAAIEEMNKHNINQWDELYPDKNIIQEDIEKGQLYVGRIGSEIVCTYVLNSDCDEQYNNGNWKYKDSAYSVIHRLCVNPKFQNQDIGRLTLKHIEEILKNKGVETIRLDVFSLNPFALKMYYKQEYIKVGEVHWRKGKFYLMEKTL